MDHRECIGRGARHAEGARGTEAVGQEADMAQEVVVQVVEVEAERRKKKSGHVGAGQATRQHTRETCRKRRCRPEDTTEVEGEAWEVEGAREAQELRRQRRKQENSQDN
jgi:hypothetical protein